jgi:predicted SAM-dependent methyltransferase
MIAQSWKDLWYLAWAPALRGNLYRHRLFRGDNGERKLNIGCGTNQFSGWTNIDGNFLHRPDMWLDVRVGLPFPAESVSVIYSCHFLNTTRGSEIVAAKPAYVTEEQWSALAVPNLKSAIEAYHAESPVVQPVSGNFSNVKGRFANATCCAGSHRLMFDYEASQELLAESVLFNYKTRRVTSTVGE